MLRAPKKSKPVAPRDYRGMTGEQLVVAVREDFGLRTMLSFSRGKDALACYIAMRDTFGPENIVPYYCYIIPGLLSFERESLEYFESVMGRKIHVLPHPGLYRMLGNCILQPADRVAVLQAARLPQIDFGVIRQIVREAECLPPESLVASGVRAADSGIRRVALSTHGPLSLQSQQYYPVHDWNKDRVISEIKRSGIHLPEDYHLFGRTFDGLDLRFLVPLKRHKPDDYRKILHWYPFAELEVWLMEKRGLI